MFSGTAGDGLDGLSCRNKPCSLSQPIQAAAEAYVGAIEKPLPLGDQEAAVDNFLQFIHSLQWLANWATTESKPWEYSWLKSFESLWILVSFNRVD